MHCEASDEDVAGLDKMGGKDVKDPLLGTFPGTLLFVCDLFTDWYHVTITMKPPPFKVH